METGNYYKYGIKWTELDTLILNKDIKPSSFFLSFVFDKISEKSERFYVWCALKYENDKEESMKGSEFKSLWSSLGFNSYLFVEILN